MNGFGPPSTQKSSCLTDTTVQEIQLDLIRRTEFNNFYGEKVVADPMAHQEWWEAVLMDTYGLASSRGIPGAGLIKLRDLKDNYWNVDTLSWRFSKHSTSFHTWRRRSAGAKKRRPASPIGERQWVTNSH